jgi:sigma-B regulation protein RsbU (phosphoserine phosphatase)
MSSAPELPVLDHAALGELEALGRDEDPDAFAEIIELFRADLPARLECLRTGLAAGDRSEIERAAHSLQGTGGQLGLPRLRAVAARIEDAAHEAPLKLLRASARTLNLEAAAAMRALDERRRGHEAVSRSLPVRRRQAARVLVVDDEPHIARFVQFVLSGAGYEVTCVHGGEDALELFARLRPDAIVLDLGMPGLGGFGVLRRLRDSGLATPPVIVLTGRASATTAQSVRDAGASAYCAKPVAPTTLLETLARLGVLPGRSDEDPTRTPSRGVPPAREQALLSEMAVGWEALEALYEVAATAGSPGGAQVVSRTLLGRLRRVEPGLEAALWVEGDAHASMGLAAPDSSTGLLGLALGQQSSVVLEGKAAVASIAGLEPEILGAESALATPFETPSGLRGALLAWRRSGAGRLDTRLTRLADSLAGQAAALLENARLQDAQRERERLEQELTIGAHIQRTLLFSEPPTDIPGLDCAALWKPSRGVGGDFFDFLPLGGGSLDVVLGDVMGKGVPAALLGAAAKSHLLRSFTACGPAASPEALVQGAAERLMDELVAIESFVTLCYARFEAPTGRLILVNAGHTRTLRVRGGQGEALGGDNLPLGFRMHEQYEARAIETEPGDLFLFYSDGVTESRDGREAFLGEAGLARWLEAHAALRPRDLLAALASMLEARSGREVPEDDVTAVCVRVGEGRQAGRLLTLESDTVSYEAVREFAAEACRATTATVSEESCAAVAIALHETVTNVIEHAYRGGRGRIEVRSESEGGVITLWVTHDGAPFERAAVAAPAFDGVRDGGFGLFLAEAAMDEVSYGPEESGRRCVRMVKRLAG